MNQTTGYVRLERGRVAYKVMGEGPINLISTPGSFVGFDVTEEDALGALYYRRLASMARVVRLDRSGTGSSDPVPLNEIPDVGSYVEETIAVMDAVDVDRGVIMAGYDAGPMALTLATSHADRVSGLILVNTTARYLAAEDYEIGVSPEAAEQMASVFEDTWGAEGSAAIYVPSRADDPEFLSWFSKMQRLTITPGQAAAYLRSFMTVDVRSLLGQVAVPTLVLHSRGIAFVPFAQGEYMANRIPDAVLVAVPGRDGPVIWEGQDLVLDTIESFLNDVDPHLAPTRMVATVVFSDIVGSTARADEVGDKRWRALLEVHDELAARISAGSGGRLVKSTGDGFVATFDVPGRALVAVAKFRRELLTLGLDARIGVHTGEVEVRGDDLAGLGVHLASRIMGAAGPGEILVSSTVKDLVVGSGVRFVDRGLHTLKGFPESWHLFAVDEG